MIKPRIESTDPASRDVKTELPAARTMRPVSCRGEKSSSIFCLDNINIVGKQAAPLCEQLKHEGSNTVENSAEFDLSDRLFTQRGSKPWLDP